MSREERLGLFDEEGQGKVVRVLLWLKDGGVEVDRARWGDRTAIFGESERAGELSRGRLVVKLGPCGNGGGKGDIVQGMGVKLPEPLETPLNCAKFEREPERGVNGEHWPRT